MSLDPQTPPSDIAALMPQLVPFVRTLGLVYEVVEPHRARLRLPDREEQRNHVGGPHAGAMFTLGESASGAVALAAFGDLLDRALPLPATAEMTFRAVALGEVWAEATLAEGTDPAEVRAAVERGETPRFDVVVRLWRRSGRRAR